MDARNRNAGLRLDQSEYLAVQHRKIANLVHREGGGNLRIGALNAGGMRHHIRWIVGLPGTEGTVRGFSAVSLILIDEAARVRDDLYKAVRPMLAVGGGDLWLMSTPAGKRGFFYEAWAMWRVGLRQRPRAPVRSATTFVSSFDRFPQFQSTRPVRGATSPTRTYQPATRFNPRAPYGARH